MQTGDLLTMFWLLLHLNHHRHHRHPTTPNNNTMNQHVSSRTP